MNTKWICAIVFSWMALVECVPVEYVYTGDGCECPRKLGYHIHVPKIPKPPRVMPCDHGYKIDIPPIQAKAKVSYTFDFSVEEPRPPRPQKQSKLNLFAKVDRISLNKEDCPELYAAPAVPPPQPASCRCGQCGVSKPHYRYVNGKWISSKCKCKKCQCDLRRRKTPFDANMVSEIGAPIVMATGRLARSKNSIRRKRDLRSLFFRPRSQGLTRPSRYVKLYHKNLSEEKQQQGWFDMDIFTDANPFKRKTKKVFNHKGSRIVKRDIKGEYDLLEKEREEADLTLPEIIQFMPETLQPDFKFGTCQFGCNKPFTHFPQQSTSSDKEIEKALDSSNKAEMADTEDMSDEVASETTLDNGKSDKKNSINSNAMDVPSFTKRNAAIYGYQQTVAPPIIQLNPYTQSENAYEAEINMPLPSQSPIGTNYDTSATPQSPCEQRKIYAAMRRSAEEKEQQQQKQQAQQPKYVYDHLGHKYIEDDGQLRLLVSSSSQVPDPITIGGAPLQYAGDLEIPQVGYTVHSGANPMVGAAQYPVQHISTTLLDRIISDIVYRHPDFIEASSHYGGALVDPEPYQEQQTKDFIKKLIDGRLSLLFGDPEDEYLHYYPTPSYSSHSSNPYVQPRSLAYYPPMY